VAHHKRRADFIERTLNNVLRAMRHALDAEATAQLPGLLQSLDPRVKVVGLLSLIIVAALARSLWVIVALFFCAVSLALLSRISLKTLALREWIGVGIFTGFIALPALFITPGEIIYRLPILHWPITLQGARSAAFLLARVETCATLALLLVLCTPWAHVLKALRVLRVPVVIVVILSMTHRTIFLLLQTANEMWQARQVRRVGVLSGAQQRRMAASGAGVLLEKSFDHSHEIYLAMLARGFRGEVYTLDEFQLRPRDWIALCGFAIVTASAFWLGR
jgi:cobalt ECF transporter T component CbiQ